MTEPLVTPSDDAGETAVLTVKDLTVDFVGRDGTLRAVDHVNWDIRMGETLAIVGESGSGKSVSSLALMGLLDTPPAEISGAGYFRNTDLLKLSPKEQRAYRGERVAMIFQDALSALNPVFTIGFQLCETLIHRRGMSKKDARARAVELLDRVRVPKAKERLDSYPHQFSGGMRQRVMIAMALTLDPDVLIADEPTTALDVTVQASVMDLLAEIQHERQMAMVLITHDLGLVASVADQVTVMYGGRVLEQGSVLDIFEQPKHPYTADLLRAAPRLVDPPGVSVDDDLPVVRWRPAEPMLLADGQQAPPPPLQEVSPGHWVSPTDQPPAGDLASDETIGSSAYRGQSADKPGGSADKPGSSKTGDAETDVLATGNDAEEPR